MLCLMKHPLKGLKVMGCKSPLFKKSRRKMAVLEVAVYVPPLWIPSQTDLHTPLKGFVPQHLIDRLVSLRSHIMNLSALGIGGSGNNELKAALEEYLSVILGFAKKDTCFEESVEFRWRRVLDVGTHGLCIPNSHFELLCVIYMLAALTLSEANELLIPKEQSRNISERAVSSECQRDAIDLLLKAAGYLHFCVKNILAPLAPHIKEKLPADLQEGVLEAVMIQAVGQVTELQLGLAAESETATLSVKRRLACEALTLFSEAHFALSACNLNDGSLRKHLLFIRWKYFEAKAAAYYYHGLMVGKGFEPESPVRILSCFLSAQENLSDSKKTCLSFSLASPVTRPPPPWGIMKHLHHRILNIASNKLQTHGYLLGKQKGLLSIPDLPQFHLSLTPEDYELPIIAQAWNMQKLDFPGQHLQDSEEQIHKQ